VLLGKVVVFYDGGAIEWRFVPKAQLYWKNAMTAHIPANKGKKYPPEPLTRDEVNAVLKAFSKRAPTAIRNKALVTILWRGGMRISEALNLKPKDVNFKECTARVLLGKGKKSRLVGLDPQAIAFLEKWFEVREQQGIEKAAPVFCTLKGRKMHSNYVREMLKRIQKRAGIEKRVHPHGFRHTHAYELVQEGKNLNVIQRQLGHSKASTTAVYIDHIAPLEMVEKIRKREW